VGAVVVHEGSILMVRRANPPGRDHWSVPGGRVEPGETPRDAVVRETYEETGVAVRCGSLVGEVAWHGEGGPWHLANFHAEVVDPGETSHPPPAAGSDAREAAWIALGDLGRLEVVDGLMAFLERHGIVRPGQARVGGPGGA
jgi:ADP-ribose pyrophosphatase YjhB (NUDIX family)